MRTRDEVHMAMLYVLCPHVADLNMRAGMYGAIVQHEAGQAFSNHIRAIRFTRRPAEEDGQSAGFWVYRYTGDNRS